MANDVSNPTVALVAERSREAFYLIVTKVLEELRSEAALKVERLECYAQLLGGLGQGFDLEEPDTYGAD